MRHDNYLITAVFFLRAELFRSAGMVCFYIVSLFLLFCLTSSHVIAVSMLGNASAYLIDKLYLEEVQVVFYGDLVNEDGQCNLNANSELVGNFGSNCNGFGQLGEFVINGAAYQAVNISVTPGAPGEGISFTPTLHSTSVAVLTDGTTTAKVGGYLDIHDAAPGNHSLSYIISVNYN